MTTVSASVKCFTVKVCALYPIQCEKIGVEFNAVCGTTSFFSEHTVAVDRDHDILTRNDPLVVISRCAREFHIKTLFKTSLPTTYAVRKKVMLSQLFKGPYPMIQQERQQEGARRASQEGLVRKEGTSC